MRLGHRIVLGGLALLAATVLSGFAPEHHKLTLAVEATATVRWELAAMHELGLDEKHKLELTIRDVADAPAGQAALQSKDADIILSDVVWVSLQRDQGSKAAMVPYALAGGGLMVDPAAGIASIADLKGKTVAVAGGPSDKSFVILSANYTLKTGGKLSDEASILFGDPAYVYEAFSGGQAQASLNLWTWNARAKVTGKTQVISLGQMLADLGVAETPPLLGWTFLEDNAQAQKKAFKEFLDASFETRKALLIDDAVWDKIRQVMNVGDDDALFKQLRDDYRADIVQHYSAGETGPAADFFAVMSKYGGPDVVGDATALADGTFWKGYRK